MSRHPTGSSGADLAYSASLTRTVLLVLLGAIALSSIGSVFAGDPWSKIAVEHLPLGAFLLVSLGLLRLGRVRLPGALVILGSFAAISQAVYAGSGAYGVVITLYTLVILASTLILGTWAGAITTAACVGAVVFFMWAGLAGYHEPSFSDKDLEGRVAVLITLMVISGGLIVIAYRRIWASLHRARANESRARRALQQVEELAATLEVRVAERTSELRVANEELENSIAEVQTTQGQLMEASRLAGKAEVASGVLHNVGNILTSVGVSSAQIQSTTEASRLPSLVRAVDLLASQERPGAFLDEDPRGERLIEFLVAVGSRLTEEQAAISEKARLLDQKTEHMRAVIQMQQAHARASTVLCEEVEIGEVVDQAIALNQAVSGTTPFPIVRESDDHPPVLLDRHRLIQVLVNLIRNALQAIESTGRGGTVTVLTTQETQLRIVVADDGCGITEEDLPKVFELGFTTRPDGHGIGLHASACAILEMGGEMRVESEGPGLGASFTILLPLHEGSAVQDAPLAAVG